MVSNCTCARPMRTSGGRPFSAWRYFSRSLRRAGSSSGGEGTKTAVPGRVPPIQFWLRRTSPGCLLAPRTPRVNRRCASLSMRIESGRGGRGGGWGRGRVGGAGGRRLGRGRIGDERGDFLATNDSLQGSSGYAHGGSSRKVVFTKVSH